MDSSGETDRPAILLIGSDVEAINALKPHVNLVSADVTCFTGSEFPRALLNERNFSLVLIESTCSDFSSFTNQKLILFTLNHPTETDYTTTIRVGAVDLISPPFHSEFIRRKLEYHLVPASDKSSAPVDSVRLFHALANSAPLLIWVADTQKLTTWVNKGWVIFTGRQMEQELGYGWADNVHPEDFERCLETYSKNFDRRKEFQIDYRLRHHTGEYRWVLDHGIPRFGPKGEFEGYIGSCVDIHERRHAVAALERSERQLRLITDSLPSLIAYVNKDFRYVFANKAFQEWFGLSLEEIEGFEMRDVLGETAFQSLKPHLERALRGESFSFQQEMAYERGRHRYVFANYVADIDAARVVRGIFITVMDMTEQHKAQKIVSERETELRRIMETIPQAVWRTNPDGAADYFSETFYDYVGYGPNEFLGWGWSEPIHPDDKPGLLKEWQRCRRDGTSVSFEFRLRRSDGRYEWFLTQGNPFRDEKGDIVKYYGTWTNIDEQKRMQSKIIEASKQDVTEQVEARERVEQLARDLQSAIQVRDEFLSIASHELKTPVTSLKLQTQMLQRQMDRHDPAAVTPERLRRLLDVSSRQIMQLSRLIEDMLDVSRIATGKLILDLEERDFGLLVEEVVAGLRPQFGDAGMPLHLETVKGALVNADGFRLEQVIGNLLTNALRYGDQKPVHVFMEADSENVRLHVKDKGLGISHENLGRIFERFERAMPSNNISGLGLGLYISRQIVESHGGKIRVVSEPGKGSTFTVSLPLAT